MNKYFLLLVTTFLTSYSPCLANPLLSKTLDPQAPTVIFDLGGVLVETDSFKTFWQIGPRTLYNFWQKNNYAKLLKIKQNFFKTLDNIAGFSGNPWQTRDEEGDLIPYLFCLWLKGDIESKVILKQTLEHIRNNPQLFTSSHERLLISRMAEVIFTPITFVKTRKIIKEGLELLQFCKKLGYQVIILSNWDPESFQLIKKEFKELFSLVDAAIISGNVHDLKPNKTIFDFIPVNLDKCVFLDDQLENVKSAHQYGLACIHINKKLFSTRYAFYLLAKAKTSHFFLKNRLSFFTKNNSNIAPAASKNTSATTH